MQHLGIFYQTSRILHDFGTITAVLLHKFVSNPMTPGFALLLGIFHKIDLITTGTLYFPKRKNMVLVQYLQLLSIDSIYVGESSDHCILCLNPRGYMFVSEPK